MLHSCEFLEKHGYEVTYLDVDSEGLVDPAALEAAITDKTILISIMFVNNEVGTVEPIKELAAIAKKHNILFHTDGVQALGNMEIDVKSVYTLIRPNGSRFAQLDLIQQVFRISENNFVLIGPAPSDPSCRTLCP